MFPFIYEDPIAATVHAGVGRERNRQVDLGWTPKHDRVEGDAHLYHMIYIRLAKSRLTEKPEVKYALLMEIAALSEALAYLLLEEHGAEVVRR